MEGRKLLDAHVYNGWHENTKPIVTNIIVPWIFEIFVSFHYFIHTYMELKSIHYLISFCRKKDSQYDRKKETEAMKEERELLIFCILYSGHMLFIEPQPSDCR